MSDGLLGNLLVKIIGDKSDLDKALSDSEKSADKTSKSISGNLKSQFKDIDAELGGIGSKISRLLANPIVLVTAAVVGLTKAFADTTKALVAYGSEINDTAEQTGLSTDALQEYKFAAEQAGGSLASITNSVKIMTRGLDTYAETYAALGVAVKDANGQFRSANDIFDDTIAALGAIDNETERSKIALELFGRNAQELIPILNMGAGGLDQLKDKARSLGLVMSNETIKAADDLGDTTQALGATWKAFTMSLAQDALPVLNDFLGAFTDLIEKMNAAKLAKANNEIIQSYLDGKGSIIAYHDALKSMIELNQEAANDDRNSASVKTAALKEIQYAYRELERVRIEYGAAMVVQEKREADIAKDNAVIRQKEKEKEALEALRKARDEAAKEYNASIKSTRELEAAGLRTTKEAQDEVIAATQKYAEALVPIVNASGDRLIGAQALKQALIDLRAQGIEPAIESHENLAAAAIATMNAAIAATEAEVTIMEQAGAEKREELDRQLQAEEAAAEKRKQYLDITKSGLASVSDSFVALGAAIAEGENPAKAFFKTLIGTIGDTIIAFAGLVEAQGWATWPIVDWAKVIKGAGLAILGGTVKGLAASLAQGGIADQPTLAVVGDNPRAAEMVTPLTTEAYQNFAEGMLSALAERSRPAGITEATVSAATVSGSSGAGSTINLHVGTLIADDAGMRKLNRELRKFGLQENVRTGHGG
jgi:hypothetical protein